MMNYEGKAAKAASIHKNSQYTAGGMIEIVPRTLPIPQEDKP
jgi:hypothetical protein